MKEQMKTIAKKAVKGHEARMHKRKFADGGAVDDAPTKKELEMMRRTVKDTEMDKNMEKGYKTTTKRDDSGKPTTKKEDKKDESGGLLGRAIRAKQDRKRMLDEAAGMKCGGKVKKSYAKGGSVTRGDGACKKGHTKGKMY